MNKIRSSEITPKSVFASRRSLIKGLGAAFGAALLAGGCNSPTASPQPTEPVETSPAPSDDQEFQLEGPLPEANAQSDELGNPLTPPETVTGYNNFYEFTLSKERVASLAQDFDTTPWQVEVAGLVHQPRTFDLDDLFAFTQQSRVYRMRCVEAWSMVIPWIGFPLAELLRLVEPTGSARYVRFETALVRDQMPGVAQLDSYSWPYVEGLRLDEAMHDLTILATGLYGEPLPPQNGAPVRLVVPWKYGFKSLKSIVKIELVEEMPDTFWALANPAEYGFWANVNPEVPHPRWSQATERIVGETGRRETVFMNGYAEDVAGLYTDLEDKRWYY